MPQVLTPTTVWTPNNAAQPNFSPVAQPSTNWVQSSPLGTLGSFLTGTWDATTASGVTLDFSQLAVSNNGSGLFYVGGVRATAPQTSGKYYYEINCNPVAASDGGVAFALTSTLYANIAFQPFGGANNAGNGGVLLSVNGNFYAGGSNTGYFLPSGFTSNDTLGICVDLDNRNFWLRVVNGPSLGADVGWNGMNGNPSPSVPVGGNPALNTGGIALPATGAMTPVAVFCDEANVNVFTQMANFGDPSQLPFQITIAGDQIPSGFGLWPL